MIFDNTTSMEHIHLVNKLNKKHHQDWRKGNIKVQCNGVEI